MLQRDAYIRRLLLIKDEKGVNFIHGPKGSGKTMLLNLLFDSLTKIEGADVEDFKNSLNSSIFEGVIDSNIQFSPKYFKTLSSLFL